MAFLSLSNKQRPEIARMEQKSATFSSFVNFLTAQGLDNLAAYQAIKYYTQVSPLADAIDTITTECVSTKLYVYDTKKDEFDTKHPVLDLLKRPNTDTSRIEFLSQLFAYYLITGNAFVMATGPINKPPLEIYVVPPQFITLIRGVDGYTQTITYNAVNSPQSVQFNRKEFNGRFRYVSTDGFVEREMWQIRKFNPNLFYTTNWGLSPLTNLYFEIEQYIKAGCHNLAQLTNGARPSAMLYLKEGLDIQADQLDTLQEQANRFYQGPENSGKVMFLPAEVGFTQLSINNKDMDFEKLKADLTTKIYNRFKIPAPLVSESAMTYANLEAAKLAMYDFAVLPLLGLVLEELTIFLMDRYEKKSPYELAFNPDSIPALQLRRNEALKLRKDIGVLSLNEMRTSMGFEEATNGDSIFGPMSNVPIANVGENIIQEEESDEALTDMEKENLKTYLAGVSHLYIKKNKKMPTAEYLAVKRLSFIRELISERSATND